MAPPSFDDFSKGTLDLLSDDYGSKKYFKVKFNTPKVEGGAIGITSETAYKAPKPVAEPKDGKKQAPPPTLFGKLSAKWKHASGFSVDKLALETDGTPKVELSMAKLMPGLLVKCKANMAKKSGDLIAEFSDDTIAADCKTNSKFDEASASVVMANQGLQVGGQLCYKAKESLADYKLAIGYSLPMAFVSLAAAEKLKKFTLVGMYKPTPMLTLAACGASKLEFEADKENAFELGGVYKYNQATLRGKYSLVKGEKPKNALECAMNYDLMKKVKLICGLEIPVDNMASYKTGCGLTLG